MKATAKTLAVLLVLMSALQARTASAQPGPPPNPNPPPQGNPAPQSAPPPAPPMMGGRPKNLKEIDGLLVQLSSMTADMRRFISRGPAGTPDTITPITTRKDFRDEQLKGCLDTVKGVEDLKGKDLPDGTQVELGGYYLCRAFTEKKPDFCDGLGQLHFRAGSPPLPNVCHMRYDGLMSAQTDISRSANSMATCEAEAARFDPPGQLPAPNIKPYCEAVLGSDDPKAICAKIAPLMHPPLGTQEIAECERKISREKGKSGGCGKDADKEDLVICKGVTAYRKARGAGGAAACGGDEVCRLLMGGGSSNCAANFKKFQGVFCSAEADLKDKEMGPVVEARAKQIAAERKANPATSGQGLYVKTFLQKKAEIDAVLTVTSSSLESYQPKNTQEFKARKDRFAARRTAIQNLLKEFKAPGGKKKQQESDDDSK